MSNEFEKYPVLTEHIREYASFGHFSNWSSFLAELNQVLVKENRPDLPQNSLILTAFQNEPVNFLLSNALRHLTQDQQMQLCNALRERLPPPASAEDEAEKLYPYKKNEKITEIHDGTLVDHSRAVHIACAGMYTGEIEKLRNALQDLVEAVPKQQVNVDWWDDSMSAAMKQAQELLK